VVWRPFRKVSGFNPVEKGKEIRLQAGNNSSRVDRTLLSCCGEAGDIKLVLLPPGQLVRMAP
jgi:hypothetical protein